MAKFARQQAESSFSTIWECASRLGCEAWEAGSYLRGREMVKDIDCVVIVPNGKDMQDIASEMGMLLFGHIPSGCRIVRGRMDCGIMADIYLCRPSESGAMRMFLTGPMEFNVLCRKAACRRGWKLNQYGLFDRDAAPVCDADSESAIFAALEMDEITPEQREEFACVSC